MNALLQTIQTQHTQAVAGFFAENGQALEDLASHCATQLQSGNKLIFCGNGGSACDAMHIAGEFVGRFVKDRRALAAIALSSDTGMITAIANDYEYADIFSRQIEGLGVSGDVLIALSTSGKSPNILKALVRAKEKGLKTALFTGEKGRGTPAGADMVLVVPSEVTAHIQETHMVALHALAGLIETKLFCNAG